VKALYGYGLYNRKYWHAAETGIEAKIFHQASARANRQ
jgi:hypothetical protein